VSLEIQAETYSDDDFRAVHSALPAGGDPAVLQFDVVLNSPGFLCVRFAFGSDEYPAWFSDFNDTIVILVKGPCTPAESPGENLATVVENGVTENFSLSELEDCEQLFLKNQMSPSALNQFPSSLHKIMDPPAYETYYDHEFGGFSKVLTRETSTALAPGRYTVKFVIEDIGGDRRVDSALFIPVDGVKLFALAQGDYNGDGCVDSTDYLVWRANFGRMPATFLQGDGNGDCTVDAADYVIWNANQGNSGNGHFAADFNRDGCVDQLDRNIWLAHFGMTHCASRYEGEANGDGAEDAADHVVWKKQEGSCGGCSEAAMASSGPSLKQLLPENPDVNGDGDVDEADLAAIDAIVTEWKSGNASDTEAADAITDDSVEPSPSESAEPTPTFESFMAELGEPIATPPPSSPMPDQSLLVPSSSSRR
jgi:hypothetical protein